jgi:hypothetical protein
MTELVEAQRWRCPWCRDYLPDSPRGTAIDHIIPRVRATLQLGGEARGRALAAARNLTVFYPEARVHAVIRAAAEGNPSR